MKQHNIFEETSGLEHYAIQNRCLFVCLFVWLVAGKIKKKGIVLSRWKLLVRREGNVGGTSACYGRNAS